jgi:hypothetical protein
VGFISGIYQWLAAVLAAPYLEVLTVHKLLVSVLSSFARSRRQNLGVAMAVETSEVDTLVARLEIVEKQCRNLKRAWTIVLVVIVLGLSVMASRATPTVSTPGIDTIQVQRIVLTDKDGKEHGEMTANGGLPRIVLYDEKENNKIFISPYFIELDTPLRKISLDRAGLAIEMMGYGRVVLDYGKLSFADPERKLRTALIPQSLSFYYQNSTPAAKLAVGELGPSLQLEDGQGKTIWKTPE